MATLVSTTVPDLKVDCGRAPYGAELFTTAGPACDERTTRWVNHLGGIGGGARGSFFFGRNAQQFALELDLVAAVYDAVQDRVSESWIVQVGVPGFDRQRLVIRVERLPMRSASVCPPRSSSVRVRNRRAVSSCRLWCRVFNLVLARC